MQYQTGSASDEDLKAKKKALQEKLSKAKLSDDIAALQAEVSSSEGKETVGKNVIFKKLRDMHGELRVLFIVGLTGC